MNNCFGKETDKLTECVSCKVYNSCSKKRTGCNKGNSIQYELWKLNKDSKEDKNGWIWRRRVIWLRNGNRWFNIKEVEKWMNNKKLKNH